MTAKMGPKNAAKNAALFERKQLQEKFVHV